MMLLPAKPDGTVEVIRQCAALAVQHDARDRLQQDLVLLGHVVGTPHKDAARLVHPWMRQRGVDHILNRALRRVCIGRFMFVQNYEVDREVVQPPELVREQSLAHEG